MSRWDVRNADDEHALAILRTLLAGEEPKQVARRLLRLSQTVDSRADIAAEAIHLAAEASTDDSYGDAVDAWAAILRAHDSRATVACNRTTKESITMGRAAEVQRLSMRVTSAAG